MQTESPRIPPPVESLDGQSVGVHLSYIRRDMDELKLLQGRQHSEVLMKLNEMQSQYPTRQEFKDFQATMDARKVQVDDHETRIRILEKSFWKWTGVASAVGIVSGIISQIFFK